MKSTMTNPQVPQDQAIAALLEIADEHGGASGDLRFHLGELFEERDALQSQLEAAKKQIAELQGRLDAIEGQTTEMWLIKYTDPENGLKRRHVFLHNAFEDYKKLYTDATVTELIPRVSQL
ncbi:MAG: DUF5320 domain-containing protein [Pseudomonadota bacterium]